MKAPKRTDAKILENKELFLNHFRITLEAPSIAKSAVPGQFLLIRISESFDPLLRRPFSVARILEEKLELIYKVVGRGTYLLSKKKEGETLDILGPNGVGFDTSKIEGGAVLVGGGIGVAPLLSLASFLRKRGVVTYFLIGAKGAEYRIFEDELRMLGCYVNFATEDGSLGYRGMVVDLLEKRLREGFPIKRNFKIFSCGPFEMMKRAVEVSAKKKIPHQVLLESKMACGIGACLSCVVAVKVGGYLRVCKDGPVFDGERIDWEVPLL